MQTIQEINLQIQTLQQMFSEFLEYNDSINLIGENEKIYTTSNTLIKNTETTNYTSIQKLEEIKKTSLTERKTKLISDTTILNLCFELYGEITETLINELINVNDLYALNRTDIDPNNPLLKKGLTIIYYK